MQDDPTITLWTVGVQLGTSTLLACFFFVLLRAHNLDAIRVWWTAWVAEATAIAAGFTLLVVDFPVPGQRGSGVGRLLLFTFLAAKLSHALLALRGARMLSADGDALDHRILPPISVACVIALVLTLAAPEPRFTMPILWSLVAFAMLRGGLAALRWPASSETPLLGWTLVGAGVLYLLHVPPTTPYLWGAPSLFPWIDYTSVVDAASDMLIALAILVSLEQANSERLREANRRLEASREKLRQLVDLDPLTGLRNRRGLRQVLDHVAVIGGTLIVLDIDDFKRINDRHGHVAGDHCLIAVARLLERSFRNQDALFRWGGDEFLIVAPQLSRRGAEERLRMVNQALARGELGAPVGTSASVGVAVVAAGEDAGAVLREADAAMYQRKRAMGVGSSHAMD